MIIAHNKFISHIHRLPALYDMTKCPPHFSALIRYISCTLIDLNKPDFFLLSGKRFVVTVVMMLRTSS